MAKREAGTGGVYFNKTHKRWTGELILSVDPVTRKKTMKTFRADAPGDTPANKASVEAKMDAYLAGVAEEAERAAEETDPKNYTVWRCLLDWHAWVPTQAGTSQQTADKLLGQVRKWVKPALGDVPLPELDLEMLGDFFDEIAENLGAGSLRDIRNTLKRAIDYAMRSKRKTGFTGPNVINDVVLPQAGNLPRDKDFLTQDQVEKILASTEGTDIHALVMTGVMLGLRPGELRALKWDHVDLSRGVLNVLKWARKTGDGKTKTSTSRRAIRLPQRLLAALTAHRESWGDNAYVFTQEGGKQLTKGGLRWRVGKVMREIELDIDDPYVMRHTFASIAYGNGVLARDIAKMMGHNNEETFKKVYAHWLDPEVTETAEVMDNLWGTAA